MSFIKDGRWCMCVLDGKPHIFWAEDAMKFLDGLTIEGAQMLVEVHNKSLQREAEIYANDAIKHS